MSDNVLSILKVLDRQTDIVGSREISKQLKAYGVELTERTVRYHLRILDERGYTKVFGKEGRLITPAGRDELSKSQAHDKVGFVISKIDALSFQTTFTPEKRAGTVILNISHIPESSIGDALKIMAPFFPSQFVMSERIVIGNSGDMTGDYIVPEGKAAIGTVCSITVNGIFLKAGIPVTSRFGGVVEIKSGTPTRFLSLISYEGSSIDPLEIFIKSKMTNVSSAINEGNGKILASFREIPAVCLEEAKRVGQALSDFKLGGIMLIGSPNRPLLEIPVGMDKVGIVIVGGLNAIAAVEEAGIPTDSNAMSALIQYDKLEGFSDAMRRFQ
jgi:HTH-type transcriptional regulator, global nitrogen regulator NrpRI